MHNKDNWQNYLIYPQSFRSDSLSVANVNPAARAEGDEVVDDGNGLLSAVVYGKKVLN